MMFLATVAIVIALGICLVEEVRKPTEDNEEGADSTHDN